jgi:hypothetical protein
MLSCTGSAPTRRSCFFVYKDEPRPTPPPRRGRGLTPLTPARHDQGPAGLTAMAGKLIKTEKTLITT